MKIINSLSGGKTSSYIAANYYSDYNIFSLIRTSDKNCLFPDTKIRQLVSDRLGVEFIGTLEDDIIIYTMLDLEQFIGKKIDWVTGKTFDEIIIRGKMKYLPNVTQRFCTTEMKLKPIYEWWKNNFDEPVIMNIGYRHSEQRRAVNMNNRLNENGILTYRDIIGQSKNGRNKWAEIEWQIPKYPLIENHILKDNIEEFWRNKPVRFAYMNNCIGCFHRNEVLLNFMSKLHPSKFDWFVRQEKESGYNIRTFKNGINYEKIKSFSFQNKLNFDDFSDCDSGYCGY